MGYEKLCENANASSVIARNTKWTDSSRSWLQQKLSDKGLEAKVSVQEPALPKVYTVVVVDGQPMVCSVSLGQDMVWITVINDATEKGWALTFFNNQPDIEVKEMGAGSAEAVPDVSVVPEAIMNGVSFVLTCLSQALSLQTGKKAK